jgi:hypothetical protein
MAETGAGEALVAAALGALGGLSGLNGAYDGAPVKASLPYATIELGAESDWSWKGGGGRELRLAVTVRDGGERPGRLRRLLGEAEAAILRINDIGAGWRVVNMVTLRVRTGQKRAGEWIGTIEVRVRMERL